MITSWGYDGPITERPWALMSYMSGPGVYTVGNSTASFRVSAVANMDRTVSVAPGSAYGLGVLVESDATELVSGFEAVTSGTRWDMLVLRRNWQTNTSSLAIIKGSADIATAFGGRNRAYGSGEDDQPLALVRFQAGVSTPVELVDLRVWSYAGGLVAMHDLVRWYHDSLGTKIRIGTIEWSLGLDASGVPQWFSTDTQPRRNLRNGNTTRRNWPANTWGEMAAFAVSVPAGLYLLSGFMSVAATDNVAARRGLTVRYVVNGGLAEWAFPCDITGNEWSNPPIPALPYYHPGGAFALALQCSGNVPMQVRNAYVAATYVGPAAAA